MKDCKHRYELCTNSDCGVLCKSIPSKRGCDFNYVCEYDETICDEECKIHKERYVKILNNKIHELYASKNTIEKNILKLEEELSEIKKDLK